MKNKNKNSKKFKIAQVIYSLIMLLGILIIFYPFIINYINSKKNNLVINNYDVEVKNKTKEEKKKLLEEAKIYNDHLINDYNDNYNLEETYNKILNVDGDGIMGYLVIPKIDIHLPIYHSTNDEVLNKYIGHYKTSSFPVGGVGTNSMLFGHRGLPSSKLFTDLDQVKIDDIFYTSVLGKKFSYKVIDIKVVEPNDIKDINIDKDKDLVTLITCTPYAINSHRLIIVGERVHISNKKLKSIKVNKRMSISDIIPLVTGSIVILIVLLLLIKKHINKKKISLEII